ncbi:MAG: hypothetical protein M5U09_28000 [Gammaproteobacteria bacterium]|nr:hypothetical protein [Gammaproteobacteria bacterium]
MRDGGDNRTNIYLLGLAHSSAGKDWPRKVNTRIVHEIGLSECLGERFASGEGIQDALFKQPGMLFQTDEIDGMLQSINRARDARHEAIMSTLLTMYSSSNSVYPMRPQGGQGVARRHRPARTGHLRHRDPQPLLRGPERLAMLITASSRHAHSRSGPARRGPGAEHPRPAAACDRNGPLVVGDLTRQKGNLEHWHPVPKVVPPFRGRQAPAR